MAKKFKELREKMSAPAQERIAKKTKELLAEMPLHELRRAKGLSQEVLAVTLQVKQASISKLERRTDMYISSLRSHIEAMGGDLYIVASFPEGDVRITNFEQVDEVPQKASEPHRKRVLPRRLQTA